MTASHLAFYTAHGISPVRQDISDWERHQQRRSALYRQLGILPAYLKGRSVLEVGPGSGHNALYTASLDPSRFVLVEGNSTGIGHIRSLFAEHSHIAVPEIVGSRIEDYGPAQPFDFVFCEGLLSGIPNPDAVLARLADCTAVGGMLVVTCVDHLSHFPETLRRLLAQRLIDPADTVEVQAAAILPMVESHLATLGGMNRRRDDWVIDNLIHPGSIIPLINLPETISVLASSFDFMGSAPHFVTDWRWYKSITGAEHEFNLPAIEQYWLNAHNLLDHRFTLPLRPVEANQRLYDLCTQARALVESYEATHRDGFIAEFADVLDGITADAREFSPPTADALADAAALVRATPNVAATAASARFGALFGRGQQYLSLSRRR
jgi:SAM-dependent methyltransferase